MKTAGLNSDGDWQFGRGLASYISNRNAVRQKVVTRLKSFANDWFLDVTANIDWVDIFGQRNNEGVILSEVERVVLETDGVATITNLTLESNRTTRNAKIYLSFTTIYDDLDVITETIEV